MGRLKFIGLGLYDENSATLEAVEAAKGCDIVLAESYTSILAPGAFEKLEKSLGRKIGMMDRKEVEQGSFLSLAKEKTVGLLIPGDSMTATTHVDLRMRAAKMGIETELVHGTSILSAIPGILGLQHYKFGRTITVPFPQKGFDPTSHMDYLVENKKRGLHTIALLDIQAHENRFMTANEGLKLLLEASKKTSSEDVFDPQTLACVVARAGSKSPAARADSVRRLVDMDFGNPLHTIVVPGKLHFSEAEALISFASAPDWIAKGL